MKNNAANLGYYLIILWEKNKKYFFDFSILTLAMVVAPLLAPIIPKVIISDILSKNMTNFLTHFIILAFVSCLAAFICSYYSIKNDDIFVGLSFRLKENIQANSMTMPFENTENPTVLNKINSAMSAVDTFVSSIHKSGTVLLSSGIILAVYLVIICNFQPIMLIVLILNVVVNILTQGIAKKYEFDKKQEAAGLNRKKEYVFGLMYDYRYGKEVRLYAIKNWLITIYDYYKLQCKELNQRIAKKRFLSVVLDIIFTLIREGVIYLYLIYVFIDGGITIDNFILYTGITASFAAVGLSFVNAVTDFSNSIRNISEYRNFLEEDNAANHGNGMLQPADTYEIEFRNLSFHYPGSEKYILKNFSYKIKAGKHIAVIGLNGAGKTTLIKLLCGLYCDYEGDILVGGVNIKSIDCNKYKDIFAAVFQESKLLSATIYENIALTEKRTDESTKRAEEALKKIGLYDKVMELPQKIETSVTKILDDDGIEFSGGERQKLVISRAIYKNGKILILDEPTAALDAFSENAIYEDFDKIAKNKTTIFISHRLNSTKFCDEILLLGKGKIVEQGTHDELYAKKGEYHKMFEMQAAYYLEQAQSDKGLEVQV